MQPVARRAYTSLNAAAVWSKILLRDASPESWTVHDVVGRFNEFGVTDGSFPEARFRSPAAPPLIVPQPEDDDGETGRKLYVADDLAHTIRRRLRQRTRGDGDGTSRHTQLVMEARRPTPSPAPELATTDALFVSDTQNNRVRRADRFFDGSLGNVTTVLGDGFSGSSAGAPLTAFPSIRPATSSSIVAATSSWPRGPQFDA